MNTTTTFAIGLSLASLTRPPIVTVARAGLSIFSTGDVSSEVGAEDAAPGVPGAGATTVESGVGVGAGEEVGSLGEGVTEAGAADDAGVGAGSPTGVIERVGAAAGVLSGDEAG